MKFETAAPGQKYFAPEVVQTSTMDCGPAALKSILDGFNIQISYGRLREACQTDVDGTSINTIEDIANQLGLEAEQVMLPADHLVLPEAQALPAIVVVQRPSGLTHFLVVWGRLGNFLQVMDPATGRRWPTLKNFLNEIYLHTFPVSAEAWRDWAGSEGLLAPLRRRLETLEVELNVIEKLVQIALQDNQWRSLATLDAATRMTTALVDAKGILKGEEATRVLQKFFEINLQGPLPRQEKPTKEVPTSRLDRGLTIPSIYWSVLPLPESDEESSGERPIDKLALRGAVLIRVFGRREPGSSIDQPSRPILEEPARLTPDLEAALKEPSSQPELEIWSSLKEDGLIDPVIIIFALFLATLGITIEALLFQGMIQIGQIFISPSQRIVAALAVVFFVLALLILEFPLNSMILRMGRRLEARLRITFLEKIPRLGDHYFRSRLTSDMTQRAYDLRQLRFLPSLGVSFLRTFFQLILTSIGVIWLDPVSAPFAFLGTAFFIGLSYVSRPLLQERDLRLRTHLGALSRFYLDALLGLIPLKTHAAERAMRRQHETQLFEWVHTGREYYSWTTLIQSVGTLLYSVFAFLIVISYLSRGGETGEILLLFYWTLSLPALGQSLAELIQQYPVQRNRVLRLLEPLGAPDEEQTWNPETQAEKLPITLKDRRIFPVSVQMENVNLFAGGHLILEDISLNIEPGEHIAIVGVSGAGKSSLVGLLLGWQHPSQGKIFVDGNLLDGELLQTLRRETAWVDPAVQLWNRSLYDNLRYGIENTQNPPIGETIRKADLFEVLDRLPDGLKTILGEGGGLVSGGEGQRVRLGRAMLRPGVRLVILDEPFRGLDREKRRHLLREVRKSWEGVTLLCVTHDVKETQNFPRVLVIEQGRIIEDGAPKDLAHKKTSRYYELLEAEKAVQQNLWAGVKWRRFVIEAGVLRETENETTSTNPSLLPSNDEIGAAFQN